MLTRMTSSKEPERHRFQLLSGLPREGSPEATVVSYTNRHRDTYYLHRVHGKDGRHRYVPRRSIQAGAMTRMPDGFEFGENLQGRVSVRRGHSFVPIEDFERVRSMLAWARSERLVAERSVDSITVHEFDRRLAESDFVPDLIDGEPLWGHLPILQFEIAELDGSEDRILAYDVFGPESHVRGGRWTLLATGRLPDLVARCLRGELVPSIGSRAVSADV